MGKRKERRGILDAYKSFVRGKMDNTSVILRLIIVFATLRNWHLTKCEVFSESEQSSIDETVEELMKCRQIPGLGLSIAKQDQILAKGYGMADLEENTPMTENTLTCIGSAAKAFTSALLAVLITEDKKKGGTLSWKTTLREIFGEEFRLTSDPVISSHTTLEDILSHRSGVGSADALLMAQVYPEKYREVLRRRLNLIPKKGQLRGQFSYNNLMYGLAGMAAEAIGGKPYFELMREKLLEPLNITTAVMVDNLDYGQTLTSKPHQMINGSVKRSDVRFYRLGPFSPAGGLCLSPTDLTKWLYFMNNYGTTPSKKKIVNGLVFMEMTSSKVGLDFLTQLGFSLFGQFPQPSYTAWYGMGWFGRFYRGSVDFFHGGSMFSYNSVVVVDSINKTGIAVTVNGLNPTILELDLYPLAYYLKDLLLNKTPWLNETTICSYPEPWGNPAFRPLPTQNVLEKYIGETGEFVGVFGHTLYGEVLVTENNQSIDLKWGEVMKGTLYDRRNLSFSLRVDDDVFRVLGKEIGVIKVVFNQFYSGQYNNIEITFQGMMETYTFSRDVEFNFFLPSKSTSSSTARLNSFTTEFCPFFLLFILVNLFFPL